MSDPCEHDTRTPPQKLKELIYADLGEIDLVDARNHIIDLRQAGKDVLRYIERNEDG